MLEGTLTAQRFIAHNPRIILVLVAEERAVEGQKREEQVALTCPAVTQREIQGDVP